MQPNNQDERANQPKPSNEAAANVVRSQIDNIYSNTQENPYQKTHSDKASVDSEGLKKYHSAWQDYYQKYYQGIYGQAQTTYKTTSQEEAIKSLRGEIRSKISSQATKIKKSRHYKPLLAAFIVVALLLLIQYNRVIVANVYAYVSPGSIDPQNIVINPIKDNVVPAESKIIIPKINVDVPVYYDVGNDYDSQMATMDKGLAHFAVNGANSHPGEKGNTVVAGHSANGIFSPGDYKFIFAGLDKLQPGDVIYANYKSVRYTYTVSRKEVVEPTDVNKLVIGSDKPYLTLLTCTPLGTARYRLLVFSDQVSPNPTNATAPASSTAKNSDMPGTTPTFFEWLFGLFN
jgi:sortase A